MTQEVDTEGRGSAVSRDGLAAIVIILITIALIAFVVSNLVS